MKIKALTFVKQNKITVLYEKGWNNQCPHSGRECTNVIVQVPGAAERAVSNPFIEFFCARSLLYLFYANV